MTLITHLFRKHVGQSPDLAIGKAHPLRRLKQTRREFVSQQSALHLHRAL